MTFPRKLHLAIKGVGLGGGRFEKPAGGPPIAIDRAAGQKDDPGDAGCASRLEQRGGPVAVAAHEACRVIAFAAAEAAWKMVEGGMHEAVEAGEGRSPVAARLEAAFDEAQRDPESVRSRTVAAEQRDLAAVAQEPLDDEAADHARAARHQDALRPHRRPGFSSVARSGTGRSSK